MVSCASGLNGYCQGTFHYKCQSCKGSRFDTSRGGLLSFFFIRLFNFGLRLESSSIFQFWAQKYLLFLGILDSWVWVKGLMLCRHVPLDIKQVSCSYWFLFLGHKALLYIIFRHYSLLHDGFFYGDNWAKGFLLCPKSDKKLQ